MRQARTPVPVDRASAVLDAALLAAAEDDEGSAARAAVAALCRALGWNAGHAWLPLRDPAVLRFSPDSLVTQDEPLESWTATLAARAVVGGCGLAGAAVSRGRSLWRSEGGGFSCGPAAREAGFQSGLAMPLMDGRGAAGVLEFYGRGKREPDEELRPWLDRAASRLGAVLAQKRRQTRILEKAERSHTLLIADLHDGLGQTLAGLGMLARSLEKAPASPSALGKRASEISRIAAEAVTTVRLLASEGRLPLCGDRLQWALARVAAQTRETHGVECRLSECAAEPVPAAEATQLLMIAQEAVANALQHAPGCSIELRLEAPPNALVLSVEDRGGRAPRAKFSTNCGSGLSLMAYRARLMDGRFVVERTDSGTLVRCQIARGAPS